MGCLNEIIVKPEWTDILYFDKEGTPVEILLNFKSTPLFAYQPLLDHYAQKHGKQKHEMVVLDDGIEFQFADGTKFKQCQVEVIE